MAIIGCSYLKYAKYAFSQGAVVYSDGGTAAKLVNLNLSLDAATDNDFYADNAIDETDNVFAGGTITLRTNDLTDDVSKVLLGLAELALSDGEAITGNTDSGVKEIIYDNTQLVPYLGIGMVIKHKRNGVDAWTGIVLQKVQFAVPPDAAETQGKTISWQTPELTGKIFRDDTGSQCWKKQATWTTEAQAINYVNTRLNITEPPK